MQNKPLKKILSFILSVILLFSAFSVLASAADFGSAQSNKNTDLNLFAQKLVGVIRNYDKGDGFIDDGEFELQQGGLVNAAELASGVNASFKKTGDKIEISTGEKTAVFENGSNKIKIENQNGRSEVLTAFEKTEFSGDKVLVSGEGVAEALDFTAEKKESTLKVKYPFATRRLIVKTKASSIDKRGAAECISGYNDLFILQYNSVSETSSAYDYYCELDNIIYVEPDYIRIMQSDEAVYKQNNSLNNIVGNISDAEELFYDIHEKGLSWVSQKVGFDDIKSTLAQKLLPQVTVAVIDSGVQTDHVFLKDRLLPNNLNLSTSGATDSIEDDYGHGTHVSGIVVDNTLSNVKIKPYKVLNNEGKGESSLIAIAVDKAVEDGVNVINMSLSGEGESQVLTDAVNNAVSCGINVVVAAGNKSKNLNNEYYSPACIDSAITVSSISQMGRFSNFSNYGDCIDISAYGESIKSSYLNNTYTLMNGTSMSAPLVSAGVANLKSFFPKMSAPKIEERLKKYSIKQYNDTNHFYGSGYLYLKYILQELSKTSDPIFSVSNENFTQSFNLTLSCPEVDSKIYYILNSPDEFPQVGVINSTEYTRALRITTDTRVSAIAVVRGKLISSVVTYNFKRVMLDEDSKYDIDSSGKILAYYGKDTDLVIPNKIKGIKVSSLAYAVFQNNNTLKSVTFPDAITQISPLSFSGCTALESIYGNNITSVFSDAFSNSTIKNFPWSKLETVGSRAFSGCSNLQNIDLSNVKKVEMSGFENVKCDFDIVSDKLQMIDTYAFRNSNIKSLNAPNLNIAYTQAFENCVLLEAFNAPRLSLITIGTFANCTKLKKVNFPELTAIGQNAFKNTPIRIANFPKVTKVGNNAFEDCIVLKFVNLHSAASVGSEAFLNCEKLKHADLSSLKILEAKSFSGCKILGNVFLPSVTSVSKSAFDGSFISKIVFKKVADIKSLPQTLKRAIIPSTLQKYSNLPQGIDCTILGTAGTTAQKLAENYRYRFAAIPYLYNPLPQKYDEANGSITVDCVGYNLSYQWYKTNENNNISGTPIENAHQKSYIPSFKDNAQYYYCVVTSNDNGVESTFTTKVIQNDNTLISANYTEYNNAVEQANALIKENYVDFSAVTAALAVDVSGKNIMEQDIVNAQTKAILDAIKSLTFKGADYTEYNNAVKQANALIKENYVDFSAVTAALAVDVSGKNITEQDIVNEQTTAILTAIKSLTFKGADYTEYNNAVKQANALIKENYVDFSAVTAALAVDVSGKNITEQDIVNEQTKAILDAIKSLAFKGADYTEYNNAVKQANALIKENYVDFSAVTAALAVDVSGKNITEQDIVNEQTKAILTAIKGLTFKGADYTEYNNAVKQANALIKENYVDFSAVTAALAVDVSGKNITEQDIVNEQTKAILDAIKSLTFKGADYTEYNNAVKQANALIKENYVDFSAVTAALAVDVSGKNITEQDIVNEQTKAILTAINKLKLKPADNSRLEAVLKAVPVDLSVYTAESQKELTALLGSIKYGSDITNQQEVDLQTSKIKLAILKLEYKKADYSKVQAILNTIPNNLSAYTPESVEKLKALIEQIDYTANITDQDKLDLLSEEIRLAAKSLELKKSDEKSDISDDNKDGLNGQNVEVSIPKTGAQTKYLACTVTLMTAIAAMVIIRKKRENN